MKTQIFAYNGVVGVDINENTKFLNNPTSGSELGMVIHTKDLQITQEAKDILSNEQNFVRQGGSFASFMATMHANGDGGSLAFMGFYKPALSFPHDLGRDCDLAAINEIEVVEVPVDEGFKNYVDTYYENGKLIKSEE